ncbi:MAG: DUF624 domain-containing protein [Clostridiaceae bacterium]|nr:DUF624 domain-containing protein [Clostridiaceae bacterium]
MAEEEKILGEEKNLEAKRITEEEEKIFDVAPGEEYVDNRSRLRIFFQVFTGKFWRLITVNLMFLLFNIPALAVAFLAAAYLLEIILPASISSVQDPRIIRELFLVLGYPAAFLFLAVPAITVGPAQAGMTYLLRCYSLEIPTFTWSDFKDKMKENLKQGTIVCIINLLLTAFFIFDLYIYSQMNTGSDLIFTVANSLLFMMLIIFIMMNFYIYPMMVTYELNLKALYKNAFLFALAKFLPNLGILVLCIILILGPIILIDLIGNFIVVFLTYLYYIILGFTLPGLIINFYVNPVIDKYLRPDTNE